jgi:hypothetical protein
MAGGIAVGQAEKAQATPRAYSGTVVDPAGQPAAGCGVWLFKRGSLEEGELIGESAAGPDGHFAIRTSRPAASDRSPELLAFFARDAKGRIAVLVWWQSDENLKQVPRLRLVEVGESGGRLVDGSGRPLANIKLRPTAFCGPEFGNETGWTGSVPMVVREKLSAVTGADGRFVIRGVPAKGTIYADIEAGAYGHVTASWEVGQPATIALDRVGSIRGTIACPVPSAAEGLKLSLSLADPDSTAVGECRVWSSATAVTQKRGRFSFVDVVPGKYDLELVANDEFAYYLDPPVGLEVKPGQTLASVTVSMKPCVKVRGSVVDAQSGAGVKRVEICLDRVSGQGGRCLIVRRVWTDERGMFTDYVRPGDVEVFASEVPGAYVLPSPVHMFGDRRTEITTDTTLPPIRLERAAPVEGLVLDASGKPVAGAQVVPLGVNVETWTASTDSHGRFKLRGVSPKAQLSIRARGAEGVTERAVTFDRRGPLRLVVSPKNAFAIRGQLIDQTGKPIRGSEVGLSASAIPNEPRTAYTVGIETSDSHGRFAFRNLWPGDQYHVMIDVEGYDQTGRDATGVAGRVHDLGRIGLVSLNGRVEGIVVDSSGRPVSGVHVFNAGDAATVLSTTSDASGRFRLEGLRWGPVYVLAEKPGHRFTGVRTASDASGLRITLFGNREPLPPGRKLAPPELAAQRKLARRLLEKLWAQGDHRKLTAAVGVMAQIDLGLAHRWAAELGDPLDMGLRATIAEKTAEDDLDEAISLLPPGWEAVDPLERLANRFADSDPVKALRCAEELMVRARAADQPNRAVALAAAGALVARLGRREAGRKLVEGAVAMARKLSGTSCGEVVWGRVAVAVGAYDLKRALAMLQPKPAAKGAPPDRSRQADAIAGLAVAVCRESPDQALALVGKLEPALGREVKMRVVCRLAPVRPADALRVAESISALPLGEAGPEYRPLALGWVAAAMAPRDRLRAFALVDRALDACVIALVSPNRRSQHFPYDGGPVCEPAEVAGFLATRAAEIGHPDMESVIYRVLATRPAGRYSDPSSDEIERSLTTATFLALLDPQSAKELLTSIEWRTGHEAGGTGNASACGQPALADKPSVAPGLKAWLLADPTRGEELFDQSLAQLRARPDDSGYYQLIEAAQLLAVPWSEKPAHIASNPAYYGPHEEP